MPLSPEDVILTTDDDKRLIELVEKEIDTKLVEHAKELKDGKTLVYTVPADISDDVIKWVIAHYRNAGWVVMQRTKDDKIELLFKTRYSLYRQL